MSDNSPEHTFINPNKPEKNNDSAAKQKPEFLQTAEQKSDSLHRRPHLPDIRICETAPEEFLSLDPPVFRKTLCHMSVLPGSQHHRHLDPGTIPLTVRQHYSAVGRSTPHFNSVNTHSSEMRSKPNVFYVAFPNNNNNNSTNSNNNDQSEDLQICHNPNYRDPTRGMILPNLISSRSFEDLHSVPFRCSAHEHQVISSSPLVAGAHQNQPNFATSPTIAQPSHQIPKALDSKSNLVHSWNNPFDPELIVSQEIPDPGPETTFIQYGLEKQFPNFGSALQFDSGEDLMQDRRKLSMPVKWCHRITMISIGLLIFICLCYRIIDWFGRYEIMKTLFIYTKTGQKSPLNFWSLGDSSNLTESSVLRSSQWPYGSTSSGTDDGNNRFTVTLCNLNLLRGSALFSLSNGSNIYDAISAAREKEFSLTSFENFRTSNQIRVPTGVISRAGHRLEEMLKHCYAGNSVCTHRNFTALMTVYGQCYMMKLQPMVHEIKFLLDAQEFEYIIPHGGVIGFRMWIHANEQDARQSLNPIVRVPGQIELQYLSEQDQDGIRVNEIFVGTEFQTIIRVSLEMNLRSRPPQTPRVPCLPEQECPLSSHPDSTKLSMASDQSQKFPIEQISQSSRELFNARIVSTTQISKSRLMHSLLALRFPALFDRNANRISWALRIQQRAFLRLTNQTAFEELKKLVPSYTELQNQASQIVQHLRQLEMGLWRDQREILQMTQTESVCSKFVLQYFGALLNITENFNYELCQLSHNDTVHTIEHLNCRNSANETTRLWSPTRSSQTNSRWHIGQYVAAQNLQYWTHQPLNTSPANPKSHVPDSSNDFDLSESSKNPSGLELEVMHLFFTGTASNPQLKDILRKYLRLLSAKRMQMGSRSSAKNVNFADRSISQTLTDNYDNSAGLTLSSDQIDFEKCSPTIQDHVDVKYQNQLETLGETIAKCLQRLEQFATAMETIVTSNRKIIQSFPSIQNDLWKTPESSLVSLIVQVETTGIGLNSAQLTSMDTVVSPTSEILGICFGTLGLLIPLLLLADYCFTLKCSRFQSRRNVTKQTT